MKKLFLFTIPLALLASCEKDPDMEKLDGDLAVYTDYAPDADFGSFDTYYLPDSILEVNGNRATFWKDENSDKIISEIESEMNDKGYTRTGDKETASLGIQVSYLAENNRVIVDGGGWYPGWWDYSFWGPWWGGWYYPYTVSYTYSYATHSLMIEMADLQKKNDGETKNRLPIIWFGEAYGFRYGNNRYDMNLILDGIDQAFRQSDYLGKNK